MGTRGACRAWSACGDRALNEGIVVMLQDQDQDRQLFDGSPEWWPEHLAPISDQFAGAVARDYMSCALLVQPPKLPRTITHLVYVDAASVTSGSTESLDQKIRRWDALIGEVQGQGQAVVALMYVGFGGDVLTVPYLHPLVG